LEKWKRAQKIRAQSLILERMKKKMKRREKRKREVQRNIIKSMEMQAQLNIEQKRRGNSFLTLAKYNDLKLKEWFTIQSELSALAKNQTEAKKINRLHRIMRNRHSRKTQEELGNTKLTNSEYDE
jgi:hypothetical protein